VAQENKSPVRP